MEPERESLNVDAYKDMEPERSHHYASMLITEEQAKIYLVDAISAL